MFPVVQVPTSELLAAIKNAGSQVILLDSCRNNIAPTCKTRSGSLLSTAVRAFSSVYKHSFEVHSNVLLMTSTGEDRFALDSVGVDGLSPFASALKSTLSKNPKTPLWYSLREVKERVNDTGVQQPEIKEYGRRVELCLSPRECTRIVSDDIEYSLASAEQLLESGNISDALRVLTKLASENNLAAARRLAEIFETTAPNPARAIEWRLKLAKSGSRIDGFTLLAMTDDRAAVWTAPGLTEEDRKAVKAARDWVVGNLADDQNFQARQKIIEIEILRRRSKGRKAGPLPAIAWGGERAGIRSLARIANPR